MELAVVNMQSAILGFFQDVVKGCVPADVFAGILCPGNQHLTRRLICAGDAEDKRRGIFV